MSYTDIFYLDKFRYRNEFAASSYKEESESSEDEYEEHEATLYYAICEDDRVGLARLLKQGLNPDTTFNGSNQLGKSVLHLCCEKGREECATILLEAGAQPDVVDEWYMTPLTYSISTERVEMTRLMVKAGCFVNSHDRYGKTAIHHAVANQEADCMLALIKAGADLNAFDDCGRTPVWTALMEDGYCQVLSDTVRYCQVLEDRGAFH